MGLLCRAWAANRASLLGKAKRQDFIDILPELLYFGYALETSEILELPGRHLQTQGASWA